MQEVLQREKEAGQTKAGSRETAEASEARQHIGMGQEVCTGLETCLHTRIASFEGAAIERGRGRVHVLEQFLYGADRT